MIGARQLHMLGQWTAMRLSNRWPSRRSVGKGFRCTADECALLCSIFGTDVRDQVLSCWRKWLQLRRLINGVCRFICKPDDHFPIHQQRPELPASG
jgi:hypothetical protein